MSIKRLSTFPRFWRFSPGMCRALPSHTSACQPCQVPPAPGGCRSSPLTSAQTPCQPQFPPSLWGCSHKLITISSSRGLQGTRGASPPQQALLLAEVTRAAFQSTEMPEVTSGTAPQQCLPAQPLNPSRGVTLLKAAPSTGLAAEGRRFELPVSPGLILQPHPIPQILCLGEGNAVYHLEGDTALCWRTGNRSAAKLELLEPAQGRGGVREGTN